MQVGTHEELLKKGGLYSELIRRQALDTPPPEAAQVMGTGTPSPERSGHRQASVAEARAQLRGASCRLHPQEESQHAGWGSSPCLE